MNATDVTVAALTFRRPDDLAALLPALAEEARATRDTYRIGVLIVDNDPGQGARRAVEMFAEGSPVDVRYAHEPRPNIAAARNLALDLAGTRLLVFIDDDERPTQGWLGRLLEQHALSGGAGVVGPVVSAFDREPDDWVRAGRFFDRRRFASGTAVRTAATNNLLLDLVVVRRLGLRFDLAFGLTGGEDMLFTRKLTGAGERLVWCDEAVVTDVVPAARLTRRWVVMRALSSGNSWGLTSVALARSRQHRLAVGARLLGQGAIRVLGGGSRSIVGILARRPVHHARGLRTFMRGIGMIAGALGLRYEEYKRPTRVSASR